MAPPRTRYFFNRDDPELNVWPEKGWGYIYMYTFRNGKRYIGQTIRSVAERTVRHNDAKMEVDKVIRSGAKFVAEILAYVPVSYLNQAEYYCISKFGTMFPNGYNSTNGGDKEQLVFSEEARRKISEGVRRRNADPKFKKKMAKIYQRIKRYSEKDIICLETGKIYRSITSAAEDIGCTMSNVSACIRKYETVHTAKGYHFVMLSRAVIDNREELLNAMMEFEESLSRIGYRKAGRSISKVMREKSVPVRCLELNRRYDNTIEASTELGIDIRTISSVCRGKNNTAGGYHFIYDSEYAEKDPQGVIDCLDDWANEKKMMGHRKRTGKPSKKAIPVRCVETNEIFHCYGDAGKRFGCSSSMIYLCCSGKIKTTKGYHFEKVIA